MSGIIQRKSTPSGIASPSAGSVFMGVDTSGVFYTKDESGTVTVYPTEGGTFTGGTVSTLNIDFTDNLQFKTNESLDSVIIDPIYEAKLVGEFLGLEETGSISGYTATSYNGIFDGILDIAGGFAQLPLLANVQTFTVTDGALGSIFKFQGLTDYTPFGGGISLVDQNNVTFSGASGSTEFGIGRQHDLDGEDSQMRIVSNISYPDVDETSEQYVIQFNGLTNGNDAEMYIGKNVSSNIIDESIDFGLAGYNTGFQIINSLSDNTASLFGILDNNSTRIFDVRNDGVTVSSLSATTLSSTTLNIDFTDTLDFISSDDLSIGFGAIYLIALNDWVELNLDGDTLVQQISTPNNTLIINGVNDVTASLVGLGLSFPVRAGGTLLNINDGDYAGSVLRIAAAETDQTSIGGDLGRSINFSGDFIDSLGERNQFSTELGIASSDPYWNIARKINDLGEEVAIVGNTNQTGFVIQNDLSDNEASLLDIRDNSNDTLFEVRNDGVFLPNIPTSVSGLTSGQIYTQTSAELGGSGSTKVLCIV